MRATKSSTVPNTSSADRVSSLSQRVFWGIGQLLVLLAFAALLIAAGRALLLFADHARSAIEFPYTANYGEGPLLDQTMRLLRGELLYSADLSRTPYTITNYPPLFLLVQAPFAAAFGPGFWYGRAISTAATLVAALMLALLTRALTRDSIAGAASGLSLLAIPYIFHWSALARIDALALALSLAGLWVIAQAPHRWLNIFVAVLLITGAIYTRQTYALAAPLAAFAWLLGKREIYRALIFAVSLAALVLAIFIAALVFTRGGFFVHLITANANGLDLSLIQFYIDEITRNLPLMLVGAALSLAVGAVWGRPGWWLTAPYALGATATALTIAKIGSDVNYLWELSAALCLLAGVLIAIMRRLPLIRAMLLVALAAQIVFAYDLSVSKYALILTDRIAKTDQFAALAAFIASSEEPVVLTDEFMGELVMNGRRVQFQPFEFSQLNRDGIWDQSTFLAALDRGDYPLVILYQPFRNPSLRFERWTGEMLRILNERFRPLMQIGETTLYQHVGP
ncbi:MAG: glycosyltransferase family 39 protein [Anaerolineae bacterium]|nr:glycosyltransferase family 39 protein [Anaerolineae bacterium]NUQ03161.1 glycosyltransferase family 39 protein [Anaerolineae bacterium]